MMSVKEYGRGTLSCSSLLFAVYFSIMKAVLVDISLRGNLGSYCRCLESLTEAGLVTFVIAIHCKPEDSE